MCVEINDQIYRYKWSVGYGLRLPIDTGTPAILMNIGRTEVPGDAFERYLPLNGRQCNRPQEGRVLYFERDSGHESEVCAIDRCDAPGEDTERTIDRSDKVREK